MDLETLRFLIVSNPVTTVGLVVIFFSLVAAVTPTPKDDNLWGKLYRVVDVLAMNFGRAKELPENWGQTSERVQRLREYLVAMEAKLAKLEGREPRDIDQTDALK